MLQRLNGWQRLWFVIAILGLFYAAWFALADGAKYYGFKGEMLLEFDRPECKAVIEMPAGYKLVPEPGLDNPCWNLYLYRSIYADARSNPQAYVEHMGSLQRSRALETFGFTFVVWIMSVGLLIYRRKDRRLGVSRVFSEIVAMRLNKSFQRITKKLRFVAVR